MTQGAIQPGSDIVFANGPSTNLPAWKFRYGGDSGLDLELRLFSEAGVDQGAVVTIDWATGNVAFTADFTLDDISLDDATIADLTVTGTHIFTAASALLDIGATAVASAGSPNVNLKKLATGTASLTLQSVEAGAYVSRGLVRLDASENVIIQHNTTAGAEDATVTVGADAVSVAAATTSLADASPTLSVGSGSGSPIAIFNKVDAGTIAINLQNGGTTRAQIALNASEDLILQHNTAAPAEDATVTIGADAVTIAAATTSITDATCSLVIGHPTAASGGAPTLRLNKGAGSAAQIALYSDEGGSYIQRGLLEIDGSEQVNLLHRSAAEAIDAQLTMSAALCTFSSATVCYASGGLRTGYRSLGADAACTLAATDRQIELNSAAASKAVTMTATAAGHEVDVIASVVSGGDYTLACTRGATGGTVTLNAAFEGCRLVYDGSNWKLIELYGGATFA